MGWHSSTRHTPNVDYALITGTAQGTEYDILPPVKTGRKVYFGGGSVEEALDSIAPSFAFGLGLDYQTIPVIRCTNCEGGNGSAIEASILLHIVTPDGKEYIVGEETLVEATAFFPKFGCIVLEEGERLRLTVLAVSGAPIVESVVPLAEVNGPIVTRRVILSTEEWQDLIPSPRPGKVNIFLSNDVSRPGIAQLMEEGNSPVAGLIFRRQENGSTVMELEEGDGVEFDTTIKNPIPSALEVLAEGGEIAFVTAAIRAGQTLQGKIGEFEDDGNEGKLVAVSYMEVDERDF
jgi:hypothetical protein